MMRFQYLYEIPQSVLRDGESRMNDSIYVPIDFKLRNTENNDLVWEYDRDGSWLKLRIYYKTRNDVS